MVATTDMNYPLIARLQVVCKPSYSSVRVLTLAPLLLPKLVDHHLTLATGSSVIPSRHKHPLARGERTGAYEDHTTTFLPCEADLEEGRTRSLPEDNGHGGCEVGRLRSPNIGCPLVPTELRAWAFERAIVHAHSTGLGYEQPNCIA